MADTGIKKDSKLYICATAQGSDLDQAAFEGLVWVEIGNIVTLPDFGVTENMPAQDYINTSLSQAQKGFVQPVDTSVVVGDDYEDTGQDTLRTASQTRLTYALKLEGSDAPSASLTNTIRYTRALIGREAFPGGGGEDFDNVEFPIKLKQIPIRVEPEAI